MTSFNRDTYKELWEMGEKSGKLNLLTEKVGSLLQHKFPPEVWIVDQLLPDNGVTILSGAPGSFKTWLYMEIAVKVANGQPVFGHFTTKQTGVLVVDEESGRRRLQTRFKQMGAVEDTAIHLLSRTGYKLKQLYVDAIIEKAHEVGAGLIVFDSFTRFTGENADENSSGDMSKLMDCYRQLADEGLSVLILHHNRKEMSNPALALRGSSDILAALDCHIAVMRTGQSESVKLIQTKNRDVWEPVPFELRFHENASEFEYIGSDKTPSEVYRANLDKVVEIVALYPGLTQTELKKQAKQSGVSGGDKKIVEFINQLAHTGEIEMQPASRGGQKYYPTTSVSKTQ